VRFRKKSYILLKTSESVRCHRFSKTLESMLKITIINLPVTSEKL
jgi:hypothetical protein